MTSVYSPEEPVPTNQRECGCGRSSTGFCTGLHRFSPEEWDRKLQEEAEYQDISFAYKSENDQFRK